MGTERTVRVYIAPARAIGEEDLALLTPNERSRAARFRFEKDRRLFVLARCLLRTTLGEALTMPPSCVPLRPGPNGKPELSLPNHSVAFNLSHSETQLAVAIAKGAAVGVDIEYIDRSIDVISLAQGHFCPAEIEYLRNNPEHPSASFFRFWTLKEAYLKAVGTGIGVSLANIDVSRVLFQSPTEPDYLDEQQPRGVRIQVLEAPAGYSAAVAAEGPEWQAEVIHWCWAVNKL